MATLLKCPRCQQGMDVTGVSPGTTVRCPDCGQMVRVPTGNTSVRAKTVSPPIPAAPLPPSRPVPGAPARGGTKIRTRETQQRQPAPEKKSSSGLFIGLGIGAVAVAGVVAFFLMKGSEHEAPPPPPVVKGPKEPVVFAPKLPASSDKPIVLGEKDKSEPKPTVLSKPGKSAATANWPQLMQMLRPAGGFDHLDRPEGVAFQEVKSFGKEAYPKLIGYIDDEDPSIGTAAVAVLNALTGRDSALPRGVNKSRIKAEWEEWMKNPEAAPKPETPKPDEKK